MEYEIGELITCKRCGHKWKARKPEVMSCPKCRSAYYNRYKKGFEPKIIQRKKLIKKVFVRRLLKGGNDGNK